MEDFFEISNLNIILQLNTSSAHHFPTFFLKILRNQSLRRSLYRLTLHHMTSHADVTRVTDTRAIPPEAKFVNTIEL